MAQRLEQLVQEQLRSPPSPGEVQRRSGEGGGWKGWQVRLPAEFSFFPAELQSPPPTEKEALLRKLVALLEEEAEVINQKVMGGLSHPLDRIGIAGWLGPGIQSWICILIRWSGEEEGRGTRVCNQVQAHSGHSTTSQ